MLNIDEISRLFYSPLATPHSVLDNYKLENYEYVKFYREHERSVAEMKCMCPEECFSSIFYYYFDSNDYLEKIIKETYGIKEIVFERKEAIKQEVEIFKQNRSINTQVV